MANKDNILTCVYCGKAYPPGTPTHGSQVLTDHIKICEKHPLYQANQNIKKLRQALIGLLGMETTEELDAMEAVIRSGYGGACEQDKTNALNAIHALRDTQ